MLIALTHIVGAVIVVLAFGVGTLWVAGWEAERNQKKESEEIAIRLGVSVADLDDQELHPRLIQLSSERFSNELFRNRLSDLAGLIRTGWSWLGTLIQVIVFGTVVWQTFSDGPDNAVFAWFLVGISIFFWVASVTFSLVCRLLTGRYPGQANAARKSLAEFLRLNRGQLEA
jgi:hypothetical protein